MCPGTATWRLTQVSASHGPPRQSSGPCIDEKGKGEGDPSVPLMGGTGGETRPLRRAKNPLIIAAVPMESLWVRTDPLQLR